MSSDSVVRSWARDAGIEVPTRGQVPKAVRDQYDAANAETDNPGLSPDEPSPEHGYVDAEPVPTRPQAPSGGHADEVAPTRAPGRFRIGRAKSQTVVKGKREHRRVSLESLASGAWTLLGQAATTQGLVPTGRALVLQAPVAGMILEEQFKGTLVDRIVQPLARSGETARELGALFGVPMLVTLVTVRPALAEAAVPHLRTLLRDWAIIAGPKMKARERREAKALEQLGVDEKGLNELIDGWLVAMFAAGPDDEPEAEPSP